MELMRNTPDKFYDLAIVDPPYGIGANKMTLGNGKSKIFRGNDDWDCKIPDKSYFEQLERISNNRIVWGANNMTQFLPPSSAWLFWDKGTGDNDFSDGELAFTSFEGALRMYKKSWVGANAKDEIERIHPTQKPIDLYRWILTKYATPDMHILDTHLGSGSSAIAAHYFGCKFTGIEIDKDYYDAAVKRFNLVTSQQQLF